MTTAYPGALDSFTNPGSSDQLNNPSHAAQHANINDAMEAVQAALGVKYGARVQANRSSNQSIASSTNTNVAFNAADSFDTDAFHNPSSNNDRIIIPANMGGVYLVIGQVNWAGNATGVRAVNIQVNGVNFALGRDFSAPALSSETRQNVTGLFVVSAADYFNLETFQNSGGNLNIVLASLTAIKLA